MKLSGHKMGSKGSTKGVEKPDSVISAAKKLETYGYHFTQYDGVTKMMSTEDKNTGFVFDIYNGDRFKNQERYEEIGEIITELVYERLESELKLEKVTVPIKCSSHDAKGFFFKSADALLADKLLILIHGSGVVRAGQWARSLIMNHSWESGTMEPYIKRAQEEGFGIIVTNGNHNSVPGKGPIKGSENPQDHFIYVWKHFIKKAQAKDIAVVAHSFGGVVVQHLVRNIPDSTKRIKVAAFTDSVHQVGWKEKQEIKQWFQAKTRNWVSSDRDLDEPLPSRLSINDCERVSAGTPSHVWTSHCAKDSVFKFIREKLGTKTPNESTYEEKLKHGEKNDQENCQVDGKTTKLNEESTRHGELSTDEQKEFAKHDEIITDEQKELSKNDEIKTDEHKELAKDDEIKTDQHKELPKDDEITTDEHKELAKDDEISKFEVKEEQAQNDENSTDEMKEENTIDEVGEVDVDMKLEL